MYAGGLDGKIRTLLAKDKGLEPYYMLDGATGGIECLDVHPLDKRWVCAGT